MFKDATGNSPVHTMTTLTNGTSGGQPTIDFTYLARYNYESNYQSGVIFVLDSRFYNDKAQAIISQKYPQNFSHQSNHTWGRKEKSLLIEWNEHNRIANLKLFSLSDKYFNTEFVDSAKNVDFDSKAESNNAFSFWLRTILSRL